jgi:hypothetical protein
MKNIIFLFVTIFLLSVIFTSCSKPNVSTTTTTWDTTHVNDTTTIRDTLPYPATIIGFYVGQIGNSTDYPTFQMDFLLRSDGTVRAYNNNISTPGYFDTSAIPPAEGLYTVSGDTVFTTCAYVSNPTDIFSTMAILNSDSTYMEGSWGFGSVNTGGGYFFVYKHF